MGHPCNVSVTRDAYQTSVSHNVSCSSLFFCLNIPYSNSDDDDDDDVVYHPIAVRIANFHNNQYVSGFGIYQHQYTVQACKITTFRL